LMDENFLKLFSNGKKFASFYGAAPNSGQIDVHFGDICAGKTVEVMLSVPPGRLQSTRSTSSASMMMLPMLRVRRSRVLQRAVAQELRGFEQEDRFFNFIQPLLEVAEFDSLENGRKFAKHCWRHRARSLREFDQL